MTYIVRNLLNLFLLVCGSLLLEIFNMTEVAPKAIVSIRTENSEYDYDKRDELGRGAFGRVFKGRQIVKIIIYSYHILIFCHSLIEP